MKVSLKTLKNLISEELVNISSRYQKKEKVREDLQQFVKAAIADGKINSDEDLKAFWENIDLAKTALKMVPFQVWKKM